MGSRKTIIDLLPRDVTRKIFRNLEGRDLCHAAGTCKDFWKNASAIDGMSIVLHGESQAISMRKFIYNHTKEGMQVVSFFLQNFSCLSKLDTLEGHMHSSLLLLVTLRALECRSNT